ncbi:MAG: VCBS repeat-containing protein, partial [Gemmatimonadetes bacterium]|nr:VCBS repeat-containing protein [Gemmatimonadota bacterium]
LTLTMGCNFGDLDNDGYLDFYQGTGYPGYEALMPNVMYRNLGGTGFVDVTMAGGFGHLQKGHGVAFADLDYDGDQDVYMQLGGAYPGDMYGNALFENPGFDNNWIRVRLRGVQSNRAGMGAGI